MHQLGILLESKHVRLGLLAVLALVAVNGFRGRGACWWRSASRVRQLVSRGIIGAKTVLELLSDLTACWAFNSPTVASLCPALSAKSPSRARSKRPATTVEGTRATFFCTVRRSLYRSAFSTLLHVVLGELVPKSLSLARAGRVRCWWASAQVACAHSTGPSIFDSMSGVMCRALSSCGAEPHAGAFHGKITGKFSGRASADWRRRRALQHGRDWTRAVASIVAGATADMRCPWRRISTPALSLSYDAAFAFAGVPGRPRHVLGFVHVKDVLWLLLDRGARRRRRARPGFDLRRLLREVLIMPEERLASELLAGDAYQAHNRWLWWWTNSAASLAW
jgi:hypothetical protein